MLFPTVVVLTDNLRISCKNQTSLFLVLYFYSNNLSEKVSFIQNCILIKFRVYIGFREYTCAPYRRRSFETYYVACGVEEKRVIQTHDAASVMPYTS